MRLHYYPETDSLSIDLSSNDLSSKVSSESREIADGLVADLDELGLIVGFDLQNTSARLDLSQVNTSHLPLPISA